MTRCIICKNELKEKAIKCPFCQSYQNWKRWTGDLNMLSVITLIATIIAIAAGYYQLSGMDTSLEQLKKTNRSLVQNNENNSKEIQKLNDSLVEMNHEVKKRQIEANKLTKVLQIQQEYISNLEKNIKDLTTIIESK